MRLLSGMAPVPLYVLLSSDVAARFDFTEDSLWQTLLHIVFMPIFPLKVGFEIFPYLLRGSLLIFKHPKRN